MSVTPLLDQFRHAIEQAGLTAPASIIADGKLHRFATNGDPTDDAGWYILFADGLPAGSFGDWRAGLTQKWCAKSDTQMTATERGLQRKRLEEARRQREQDEQRRHAEAAQYAHAIWEAAPLAPTSHPYLQRKHVQPHGLRLDPDGDLIVPILIDGQLASLQSIGTQGQKMFLPGGAVKGGSFTLGELKESSPVLLCEGFSTAASLHEATGALTVAAFSAGNLVAVAQQLRQQFPTAVIVLAGDNDVHDDGSPNTGLLAATAAADAVSGVLVMPNLDGKTCDFNDLARARGLDAVREAIEAVLKPEEAAKIDAAMDAPEEMPDDAPPPGPETTTVAVPESDARTRCTDVGNGELFAQQHRETVRYCYGLKQWFVWDGQRWKPDDGGAMTMLAKQTALSLYARAAQETDEHRRKALAKWAAESETERRLKSMVSLAQSEPGIAIEADRLDADPLRLNVLNGTLDLRTGDLRPARRDDFITKMAPVAYRPDATCPELDRMLTRLFGTVPAIRAYLQRILGYALTGVTTEQCFFIFYGTGSNGKSTLLNTVLSHLGEYADASRPETFLVKHGDGGIPNDVAALAGVRFVVSLESEKGKRLAEGLVKAMTGGDKLKARFLHKDFFGFIPQFKLFIGTNHKPTILGTDDGIWRRVRCVPFAVKILEGEKDTQLSTRLLAEGPGILAWLVQGCLAWQRDGLGEPLEILAASAAYRAEQDVLGVFLKDRCVLEGAAQVFKKDLFETYVTWCEESGEHYRLTMREFGKVLRERGLTETRTASAKGWLGIRIRTPLDAEQDDDDELVATPAQEGSTDVNLDT